MPQHLLLISLGPIQDFIASARRCQDLWFGSWLLSDLARTTAAAVVGASGGGAEVLIFPASIDAGEDGKPSVANKILAVLPPDRQPTEVAAAARQAMVDRLDQLAEAAFTRVPPRWFHRDRALAQVRDLMEFPWVSVPLTPTYEDARSVAERLLDARKNQRTWGAVGWGAQVPKSSLDGLRESVLDEALYEAVQRVADRGEPINARELRERWFVRGTERLCGVGLLKRVGSEVDDLGGIVRRPAFHSTSHVAAAPVRTAAARLHATASVDAYAATLAGIIEEGGHEVPNRLRIARRGQVVADLVNPLDPAQNIPTPAAFGAANVDGRVLYVGQLPALLEEVSDEYASAPERGDQRRRIECAAETALRTLLASVGLTADDVPTYYAVLLADGDNMGQALDRVGTTRGIEGHRALARALDAFSTKCRAIVSAHAGSLVYAGGDDVLALLPLHTVLQCARALHDEFGRRVDVALAQLEDDGPRPTLSVGLGIGHHLDDMAGTRGLAKIAEALAKSFRGSALPDGAERCKDALAIVVQLRSGGQIEVVDGWWNRPDERLLRWARFRVCDEIPAKAAHALSAQLEPLLRAEPGVAEPGLPPEMLNVALSLARRVFARSEAHHGTQGLAPEVHDALVRALDGARAIEGIGDLARELELAELVAHALRVAFVIAPGHAMPPEEAAQ